jgi:hypothetical protein
LTPGQVRVIRGDAVALGLVGGNIKGDQWVTGGVIAARGAHVGCVEADVRPVVVEVLQGDDRRVAEVGLGGRSQARSRWRRKIGMAMAARMPMMMTTTSSSMRVKPSSRLASRT